MNGMGPIVNGQVDYTTFCSITYATISYMYIDYEKLIGWGVGVYAVMFLLWSAFVAYGFVDGYLPQIIGLVVLIGLMYKAGASIPGGTWQSALPYSFSWVVIIGVLDIILSVPFAGWEIFTDWNLWVSYGLIFIVPLLAAVDFVSDANEGSE